MVSDLWMAGRHGKAPQPPPPHLEGNQDTAPKNSINQLSIGRLHGFSDLLGLEYVLFLGEQVGLCFGGMVHRETTKYGT